MAKKDMVLQLSRPTTVHTQSLSSRIYQFGPLKRLSNLYSRLLEETITPQRTLRLLHAQISATLWLLLGGTSLTAATLLTAWTCLSIWQCKK